MAIVLFKVSFIVLRCSWHWILIDTVIGLDSSFIICRLHIFTRVSSVYLFTIHHYYFCFYLFAQERLSLLYMCTVPDKLSIIILLTVWFYQVTYAFRVIYTLLLRECQETSSWKHLLSDCNRTLNLEPLSS